MPHYLSQRKGGGYFYQRRVPRDLRHRRDVFKSQFIEEYLGTSDRVVAKRKVSAVNEQWERTFDAMRRDEKITAEQVERIRLRGGESSALGRLKLCLAMPALPLLLFVRHFRRQLAKGRNVKQFVLATPAIVFLLVFWAIGEFVGYLEAKPAPAHDLAADA